MMEVTRRPSWDSIWMATARVLANRSKCVKRQVGAVIVSADNHPLSVGYNGPPRNLENTEGPCDSWCQRAQQERGGVSYSNCVSVHAEINAILFLTERVAGGTFYSSAFPCWDCAKAIANLGVDRIVTVSPTPEEWDRRPISQTLHLLHRSGIELDYEEA